jgi:hypothetical protein
MARVAQRATDKKASMVTPALVKPVKQALTKSALINLIAEEKEISAEDGGRRLCDLRKPVSWFSPSARRRRVRTAGSSEG